MYFSPLNTAERHMAVASALWNLWITTVRKTPSGKKKPKTSSYVQKKKALSPTTLMMLVACQTSREDKLRGDKSLLSRSLRTIKETLICHLAWIQHMLGVHRRREHSTDKWYVLTPCCYIVMSLTASWARGRGSILLCGMMKAPFPLIEPLQSALYVEHKHSRGLAVGFFFFLFWFFFRQLRGVFKRLIAATCLENRRLAQHDPRKKTKITVSLSALPPSQLCVPATHIHHEERFKQLKKIKK